MPLPGRAPFRKMGNGHERSLVQHEVLCIFMYINMESSFLIIKKSVNFSAQKTRSERKVYFVNFKNTFSQMEMLWLQSWGRWVADSVCMCAWASANAFLFLNAALLCSRAVHFAWAPRDEEAARNKINCLMNSRAQIHLHWVVMRAAHEIMFCLMRKTESVKCDVTRKVCEHIFRVTLKASEAINSGLSWAHEKGRFWVFAEACTKVPTQTVHKVCHKKGLTLEGECEVLGWTFCV